MKGSEKLIMWINWLVFILMIRWTPDIVWSGEPWWKYVAVPVYWCWYLVLCCDVLVCGDDRDCSSWFKFKHICVVYWIRLLPKWSPWKHIEKWADKHL